MTEGIVIVGLGPGDPALWTQEACRLFDSLDEIYLRTKHHPGVDALPRHLTVRSFDDLYDEAESFEAAYAAIVEEVLRLGTRPQGVVYAVPGHPAVGEATVVQIRKRAVEHRLPVRLVAGLSFLEPTLTALGLDVLPGLQIVDAIELAARCYPPLNPDLSALVAQLYGRHLAAQVKLTLMAAYPDDHPVTLVRAAGTPDEEVYTMPLYELDRDRAINHLTTLYVPPWPYPCGLESFQDTIARLRAPDGCPWDRAQTHQTLRNHLLEEAYEALEALDADDMLALEQELGDLLLQIVLHTQIASEGGDFRLADVIAGIDAKIHRRHPHVFADVVVEGVDDVLHNWEVIKMAERGEGEETAEGPSALDGVPLTLPALARARSLSERAVRVGFEWPDLRGVLDKVQEELAELVAAEDKELQAAELGDLLFTLVNVARWLGLDAESALREASSRFAARFRAVEALARRDGLDLSSLDPAALDALWEQAKEMS
jgi:tetrapyrrole methylase family protein/MazG family protein